MKLRQDQDDAITKAYGCAKSGARRILVVAPTGFGKTVTLSEIARRAVAKGKRVAWAAHRRELLSQAAKTLQGFGLEVGMGSAGRSAPVQVFSVQGVRDVVPPADLVILDEAHHYLAPEWGKLPAAYPQAVIIGATATPEYDGQGLGKLFQQLVVGAQIRELQQRMQPDGVTPVLVPIEIKRPRRQLRATQIAQKPVDAYLQWGRGERAVLFSRTIDDAEQQVLECRGLGVRAAAVHERLDATTRADILARFAAGDLDVVANVAILTEGWDCPPCSVCLLARGCGSRGLYMQIVGRVLRGCPGKLRAILVDLRGVSHAHGRPDEDQVFSLDGDEPCRRKGVPQGVRLCKVCGTIVVDNACECGDVEARRRPTEVVNEPLYDWKDAIRNDPPDRQAERLAKWLCEARAAGKQTRSAIHKFNGVYGTYPNRTTLARAEVIAKERMATVERIAAVKAERQLKLGTGRG